jgi:hypothetical protein
MPRDFKSCAGRFKECGTGKETHGELRNKETGGGEFGKVEGCEGKFGTRVGQASGDQV